MRLYCYALLWLGVSSLPLFAQNTLSVGMAEVDVSPKIDPKKPVYMAGFGHNRLAVKIADPIMARAMVLSDGQATMAFVSVDVVGLFFDFVETVREELKSEKFDYICISSTHNHEGPDTLGLWGKTPFETGVDKEYMAQVKAGIVAATKKAKAALKPSQATIGKSAAPELLHDGREPYVLHDELVAVRFDAPRAPANSAPLGILVQWNCHPELLGSENTAISADHVYYTVKHLQEKYNCPVIYFTGTVGGLMTSLHVPIKNAEGKDLEDGTFEKTELFGIAVAKHAVKALDKTEPITLTPLKAYTKKILIPVDNALYRIAFSAGVFDRKMYQWSDEPSPKEFIATKDVTKPVAMKSEVGYIQCGELGIAMIPGEIYPELVLDKIQEPIDPGADYPDAAKEPAIYTNMPSKHKMIFGLANDEMGYILPKRQWDEKPPYCYGRKKAQYGEVNSCGPEVARVLCETFQSLTKQK